MSASAPIASVENVTFAYGRLIAVENVSFSIAPSEYVCLIGRNGSGKSTLMKGMLGLLKPRSGRIDLPGGPDSTAFLPQMKPGREDFPATVWEVTISGCQRSGKFLPLYSREDRERAAGALSLLGIGDLAGRRIGSLSGGQRQRAYLARCLCRQPRLLLLDEPYTGLDPVAADGLTSMLEELRQQHHIAILMSSHDLGAVVACASRVLVLDTTLQFDGDVEEWMDRFKSGRLSRAACPVGGGTC